MNPIKYIFVMVSAWTCLAILPSFAGTTNSAVPWSDNFESYPEGTPLVDGTNGWYGSSTNVLVQTNVFCTNTPYTASTNAAIIPYDCTLSNLFTGIGDTNVLIQMDILPALYDGTNHPLSVDTNAAAIFYINSNGHFVVLNGPTSPTTNWYTITNTPSGGEVISVSNDWIRVQVSQNYSDHTWNLLLDSVLLTNNVGFVNTSASSFSGFDLYDGSTTCYLDNVSVTPTVISVTLQTQDGLGDYGDWDIGAGQKTNTVHLMTAGNCVLVKNDGNVAEDFSISAAGTSWTLDSDIGENHCVLMGLFNGDSAPDAVDFSTVYDIITNSTVWATESSGNGKFEGANNGDNVNASTGEKLYIYLKTPSSVTSGVQQTITVTIGAREH